MKVKMTTFGYELRLVKDLLPGHLARQWHVPSSILSPRPVPRPTSLVPRPKFNEFSIRPSRALTVWQIQHPARVDGPSLAQLAVVESKMDAHRAQASRTSRSFEEVRAEEQLFAEQAEALAQLQWENPVALFDSVDIDHSGTLALAELRQALMARGLSEKMAEPILRDFDADDDGEISRDEWTVGFYSSRLCTVPLPMGEDFSDLTQGHAGCTIAQTEYRAILFRQLRDVCRHLTRRCPLEKWRNFHKQVLTPSTVTLYDLARYVIRPCTHRRKCSYVELVATHPQRPRWFVSHWWGEYIFDFVACLGAHARDRMPNERLESAYWVCAYANNQWELGEAIADDPGKTTFHRALSLAQGTVAVLDKEGIIFSRIWCCYEAHVSLTSSRPGYLFDVYTCIGNGKAVGLTDGMAVCDILNQDSGVTKKSRTCFARLVHLPASTLLLSLSLSPCPPMVYGDGLLLFFLSLPPMGMASLSLLSTPPLSPLHPPTHPPLTPHPTFLLVGEDRFPLELCHRSISIKLESAHATMEADRIRILNKMAGVKQLDCAPLASCQRYDDLNGTLRARFAAGAIVRAFSEGSEERHVAMQQQMMKCLAEGQLRALDLNFDSCGNFTEEAARQLAQSMPRGLGQMTLRLHGHGNAFIEQLTMQYRLYGGLDRVKSLDFEGNKLGSKGVLELTKAIRQKFLMSLTSLKLDRNLLDEMDVITLCRTFAQGAWQSLTFLSLENNKIGDKGMQTLAKTLKDKDQIPSLERLSLRGNPASKFRVDEVNRALRERGRGLKQSEAVSGAQGDKAAQRKASRVWEPSGTG